MVPEGFGNICNDNLPDVYGDDFACAGTTDCRSGQERHHKGSRLAGRAAKRGWVLGLSSPFDVANPYKSNIEAGLNYLFNNCAFTKTIDQQEAGDPDTNNNDLGVYWESSASGLHHRTYTSAIALMAICEAVELNRVIGGSGPLTGWTYEQVARDTMDYLAWGQMDYSYYGGGLD